MSGSSHEVVNADRRDRAEVVIALLVFAIAVAAFAAFAIRMGAGGARAAAPCLLFAILFAPWSSFSVRVPRMSAARVALLWIVALLLYAAYAAGSGAAVPVPLLLRYVAYGWIPCALLGWKGRAAPTARMLAAVAALWLPIQTGLVRGLPVPVASASSLDLTPILAVELALLLFVGLRGLPEVGYTYRLTLRDVSLATAALAAFAAVAVPLGLGIGFLRYGPIPLRAADVAVRFLGIYFTVAVPEELLFRGLLQNLLEKTIARASPGRAGAASLVAASILFGAAHVQHAPAPNFRYALLAALAGLAYGTVWRRTRKVTASACTHAAVDLIWTLLLRGR